MNALIQEAARVIAARLEIEPSAADWCARYVERAGLFNATAELRGNIALLQQQAAPDYAVSLGQLPAALALARLLVALMGSSRPADAAETVKAYEALPLAFILRSIDSGDITAGGSQTEARAFWPDEFHLADGRSDQIKHSITLFVAMLIFSHSLPGSTAFSLPTSLTIERNLDRPRATITTPGGPDDPSRLAFTYGRPDAGGTVPLRVEAITSGAVIRALGELLTRRAINSADPNKEIA